MAEVYDPPSPWTGEIAAPLTLFRARVKPDWVDEFDHVNVAHYVTIADHANWAFWNWINAPDGDMAARGGLEYAIVEKHVRYLDELALDAAVTVTTMLLGHDAKRFVLFHRIYKDEGDALSATVETKFLGFDLKARRSAPWRELVAERLRLVQEVHDGLERPAEAGAGVALSRR